MVAIARCRRSFFLSSLSFIFVAKISHAGFPAFGLSSKCRLQRGVVLLQANLSRSGPLVRVAPHWNLGVIIDSLCGHFSRKSFTGTLFILNFCLYHMFSKKITYPVFWVHAKIKFWLNCRIPCHPWHYMSLNMNRINHFQLEVKIGLFCCH